MQKPMAILPHTSVSDAMQALALEHGAELYCRLRSGSHAYGLAGPQSDLDERGIYIVPPERYAGLHAIPNQISDAKGDHVYYSLRRVMELISESNPTLMEIIFTPDDCILACSHALEPLFSAKSQFISQALVRAKLGYAMGQIKKARGQNKWINQPQPEAAPTAQQFCHWLPALTNEPSSLPSSLPGRPKPLTQLPVPLEHCHVARVEHTGHWYRLYHLGANARGVFRGGGLPVCESIPKEIEASRYLGLLMFNEQGFQRAKLDHHNYWHWRAERNDARWLAQEHGQLDYDAKNLMHCMRLLFSAQNVLAHGVPLVRVSGAIQAELIAIRSGQFSYKELIQRANTLVSVCETALTTSKLPEQADLKLINKVFWQVNANFRTV